MGLCKKDVTPLLMHWSYIFLALTHQFEVWGLTYVDPVFQTGQTTAAIARVVKSNPSWVVRVMRASPPPLRLAHPSPHTPLQNPPTKLTIPHSKSCICWQNWVTRILSTEAHSSKSDIYTVPTAQAICWSYDELRLMSWSVCVWCFTAETWSLFIYTASLVLLMAWWWRH